MPLVHPEVILHTGAEPPRGVLLHGPPGCGRTMLANAIARKLGLPFIAISAPSIVSGMSGESEKMLRQLLEEAWEKAPCLIFMHEIDVITQKRDNAQRGMGRRIVAQMLTCTDDLILEKTGGKPVMIIGATNQPDSLDPALRRAGRFDRETYLDLDFKKLAKTIAGFVGADLSALVGEAYMIATTRLYEILESPSAATDPFEVTTTAQLGDSANMDMDQVDTPPLSVPVPLHVAPKSGSWSSIQRFIKAYPDRLTEKQLEPLYIMFPDFLTALTKIQACSKRQGFATVPGVTWADVWALESLKVEIQMAIVLRFKNPEVFASVGLNAPSGVLLWGPPGCGKTQLAKATANEIGANFIGIHSPELLNKYVVEPEGALRQVFSQARASIPCVIFFDELDALVPRRDDSFPESSSRPVNTLLTELDGLNDCKGIYVIAATKRPHVIDPAMIRPGRLDTLLFVDLPNAEGRVEILKTITRRTPLSNIDLRAIADDNRCTNFSGTDRRALVERARTLALGQCFTEDDEVKEGKNTSNL
ncbi:AAA-domain-containing protein [Choiromyces venosus 120613-1]|uniref:AAA-domain-containing protein n=1 Tax=Choiromyces venosus 120613-1 TaxID=1336337 RepID=A0A3N4J7W1_9PEZI|nr:AAA-domain-containing protein [Choiromyces venosus 120613-1]